MSADPSPSLDRSLIGRLAAHRRWSQCPDRTAATEAARRAFNARFEREVDPDGVLEPAERTRRAKNARKAYYADLRRRAAKARQQKAGSDG